MTAPWVETVLGRPDHNIPIEEPLDELRTERILITGAEGSIGTALGDTLADTAETMLETDICGEAHRMDVRHQGHVRHVLSQFKPTVIFHLAGAKHAPQGEFDPYAVCETNVTGTKNVLDGWLPAKVVLASTCKAANPATAYGASKLIAERMVLNRGGSVARFYNVIESSGNVFEIWRGIPDDKPIPFTWCTRYFISLREAVALLLWAAVKPSGRYTVDPGHRTVECVAWELYPDRDWKLIPPRRGDRKDEPLVADHEILEGGHPLYEIFSSHDPIAA